MRYLKAIMIRSDGKRVPITEGQARQMIECRLATLVHSVPLTIRLDDSPRGCDIQG
jgi:hypothetical protein